MVWVIRAVLIILLLTLIIRAGRRMLAAMMQGMMPEARRGASIPHGVQMERDPVCGTFVVPERALVSSDMDGLHYFCSEKCRKAYRPGDTRRAAER